MLPRSMPIFVATTPIDPRRSFDGLAAAAREQLGRDPLRGALFLFFNKTQDPGSGEALVVGPHRLLHPLQAAAAWLLPPAQGHRGRRHERQLKA